MTTMRANILPPAPRRHPRLVSVLAALAIAVLAAFVILIILIALPLTRRLIAVGLTSALLGGRLESLAVDLDIRPGLKWLFSLAIILPVSFGLAQMMVSRSFNRAARGLALAAGALLLVGVVAWVRTQHFNFDANGRPIVYLSFRRDGVHKSYRPGIDRVTGRPKVQITVGRAAWLSDLARQPVRMVDPAVETNWFDANTGEPNLWCVELGSNQWQFFNRPHFHQQLQVEAQPITLEIMKRWRAEYDRRRAIEEAARRRREEEAKVRAQKEAAARLREQQRLAEEAKRRRQAAQAARILRQRQQRRQELAERRLREATASPLSLERWEMTQFLSRILPELTGTRIDEAAFEEEYRGRRFRFQARVEKADARTGRIAFAPMVFWRGRLTLTGVVARAYAKSFRNGKQSRFVGTVDRMYVSNSEGRVEITVYLTDISSIPDSMPPLYKK